MERWEVMWLGYGLHLAAHMFIWLAEQKKNLKKQLTEPQNLFVRMQLNRIWRQKIILIWRNVSVIRI